MLINYGERSIPSSNEETNEIAPQQASKTPYGDDFDLGIKQQQL